MNCFNKINTTNILKIIILTFSFFGGCVNFASTQTYSAGNKSVNLIKSDITDKKISTKSSHPPTEDKNLKSKRSNSEFNTKKYLGDDNTFGSDTTFNTGVQCIPNAITCIKIASTATVTQNSVPITFGQPFKTGDLPAGSALEARDDTGNNVLLQTDEVSSHADGSVRFAVLSAQLMNLRPNERRTISLFKKTISLTTINAGVSTAAFNLKLTALVYSPQVSVITFGNRVGTKEGIPYLEGERITLQLGDTNPEQYVLTLTAAQAGGGYQTLRKIAEAFMARINAESKNFKAEKIGEGGGYEKLWIKPLKIDAPAFKIGFIYAGSAVQQMEQLQTYRAPRTYQATPGPVLEAMISGGQRPRLAGAVATEHTVVAPFIDVNSKTPHPQLTARLHTRFLDGGQRIRTDMVLENNWTYAPNPGNLIYELKVSQGANTVHYQPILTHNHHSRWHKVLWTGVEPQLQVRHNMRYFLDSKATWNYDLSIKVPEAVLAQESAKLARADTSPMGPAFVTPYFPGTGARADIGPLPRWTALYLLSQDPRQRAVMLANAAAAGAVPIHYRDHTTDQPVSLVTRPGLAMRFGASTGGDAPPPVSNAATIWAPDTNHQASFAYVPYLVTGDAFYLDEILFWANWNMGSKNPNYRGFGKGLIHSEEVRGQAWALRSLGEATRALPDSHAMKGYFQTKLRDNLAWYNSTYPPRDVNDNNLSQIGMVEREGELRNTRPWMNDFMTIVLGQLAENNEPEAQRYLQWLSSFTVGRFSRESDGFCMAYAPAYTLKIFNLSGKQITNWGELFKTNWPAVTDCNLIQPIKDSIPESSIGYAAVARAQLAVSADMNIPKASSAYEKWKAMTPKIDKAFESDPTWAIVPHQRH